MPPDRPDTLDPQKRDQLLAMRDAGYRAPEAQSATIPSLRTSGGMPKDEPMPSTVAPSGSASEGRRDTIRRQLVSEQAGLLRLDPMQELKRAEERLAIAKRQAAESEAARQSVGNMQVVKEFGGDLPGQIVRDGAGRQYFAPAYGPAAGEPIELPPNFNPATDMGQLQDFASGGQPIRKANGNWPVVVDEPGGQRVQDVLGRNFYVPADGPNAAEPVPVTSVRPPAQAPQQDQVILDPAQKFAILPGSSMSFSANQPESPEQRQMMLAALARSR